MPQNGIVALAPVAAKSRYGEYTKVSYDIVIDYASIEVVICMTCPSVITIEMSIMRADSYTRGCECGSPGTLIKG